MDRVLLRQLPTLFPLPAEDMPLDTSYECTAPNTDPEKVVVFGDVQRLVRARLVTPVDVQHMYDAAMQSKACRLTSTGRYYWRWRKTVGFDPALVGWPRLFPALLRLAPPSM